MEHSSHRLLRTDGRKNADGLAHHARHRRSPASPRRTIGQRVLQVVLGYLLAGLGDLCPWRGYSGGDRQASAVSRRISGAPSFSVLSKRVGYRAKRDRIRAEKRDCFLNPVLDAPLIIKKGGKT